MTVCQLRPRSRGEVRVAPPPAGNAATTSADDTKDSGETAPGEQVAAEIPGPLIYPNYLSDPYDLATAVGGLRLMRDVARSVRI
jgi:hypothetical protein